MAYRRWVRKTDFLFRAGLVFSAIMAVFISCLITHYVTRSRTIKECEAAESERAVALRQEYELEFIDAYGLNETEEKKNDPEIEEEAEWVAKVIYGTAMHNTEIGKRLTVWCIINRVESGYYPNNVKDVCTQSSQWMQFSEENPVVKKSFEIAYEELEKWHNGEHRPMSNQYIYLGWSSDQIVLRTSFKEGGSTNYFRESDWED